MSTNPQAETSTTTARCNVNQQRRKDEQDDLINFDPREYEDGYTSPTYSDYIVRPTTPIPIYYEIQLDEGKVDDDRMVIADPDNVLVLPLHDIITDNQYRNIDRQDKYEESPPILVQTPPPRRAIPILCQPILNQLPNSLAQQPPPPNLPDHQPAPGAAAVNPMDQLLQSMNNFVLAMSNNAPNRPWESKVVKFSTFRLGKTVNKYYDELEKLYRKANLTESYLSHESYNNEKISELKKAIAEIAKNMKTLVQKQNKHKITAGSSTFSLAPITSILPRPSNLTTSCKDENAKKGETIDPSNRISSILDQPLPSNLLIPLVLNSKIEMPDAFQPPIE
ncbi:35902_t:CDS:2, partial [Gigaspora margarita]